MLIVFDITCLLYLAVGIFFIKTGTDGKIVMPEKLKQCKIYLVIIMFTQFNFILYMIPSSEFWAFAFLFTVATALFLDGRMVVVTSAEIALSDRVMDPAGGYTASGQECTVCSQYGKPVCLCRAVLVFYLAAYMARPAVSGECKKR